ncbi:DNA translocase FtsK [Bacillus chungangensis]|uniref:DNA translocase FtsK n=1 Tax=Bacillus chungangensis TaxID=587633 RepID=UPI0027D78F8E|nr:DNA translocase FtsK [Bacillus chungangensis]
MLVAKKKRRKRRSKKLKQSLQYELGGIVLIAISLISIIQLGAVGKGFVYFFRFFFGEWYFIAFIAMITLAGYFMVKNEWPYLLTQRLLGFYLLLISILLLSHLTLFELLTNDGVIKNPSVVANTWDFFWQDVKGETSTVDLGGGMVGAVFFAASYFLFDALGTNIFSIVLIVISIVLITGKSLGAILAKCSKKLAHFIKGQWLAAGKELNSWKSGKKGKHKQKKAPKVSAVQAEANTMEDELVEVSSEPIISNFAEKAYIDEVEMENETIQEIEPQMQAKTGDSTVEHGEEIVPPLTFVEVENKDYQLPPISLLNRPRTTDQSGEYSSIQANARKLERTFQSFGVNARITQVHLGPAVTKYEVHPAVGVKVSKIVSLSDDIALALAAKDIRMEAPIPGKSAIGIEVPNTEVAVVSLREVLDAKEKNNPEAKLQIGLGRDITGEAVLAELNKMPHLLVAGATGSGKSVCVNGIITSILMRAKPHEVKMMMIDPKMVELNVYNGVPHLLAPVVTNPKKASQALQKVVGEMERRYDLFSHTGTRNIEGYNEYIKKHNAEQDDKQPLLPFIVVIVDELADLMMVASSDVEDSITRLAQMARAAGIHLIIATQRPSVDVITGVIKANIPSRIAFAVSSTTDSRTILDMGGAEKLLGRGDMLFLPVGSSKPVRIQGAFLSDEEVEEVVNFVIGQQKAQYHEEMIPDDIQETTEMVDDELYEDAVQLIADMQTASVSMLQRRFRIGYTRAARLIDAMEVNGIVGPYEGSKPRKVLIQKPTEEQSS